MYPRCLQQLRLSWLQTRIVTAPPTLPDNNNPSSEGQFFCRNTKEHQGHQNDVGIKRKLFLPVLVLPTAPPIVATTLEDLTYTRPPRLPTTDWRRPSKAVPPAPIVLLHSSARGTSFHPVVLTWLLAQLILRRGDLDAIKDDDQCGDDPLNHHLVINPPRARVISLRVFSSCSSSRRSRRQSLFLNVHLWIPSTGNTL